MKKKLLALIERKKNEVAELQKRSDESQDLAEVRAIGETLKKLADEMLEYRLNDKDYFKKSLESEIELIEKHPERFKNPQLELLLLKSSLIRIKNAR